MEKLLLPILYLLVGDASGAVSGTQIQAGAASIDITPQKQVYIAGYGNNRLSTGVHDSLWARCMVLQIGEQRIAFLAFDLIGLFLDDVDVIRKQASSERLQPQDIIVSCTHNHQGPDTLGLWGPSIMKSGVDAEYTLFLRQKAVECVKEAEANLAPAKLFVGKTTVEGVSRNARDKEILDPVLVALSAVDREGRTIATLVNFANHPEALGSENTLISADWPSYLYDDVEKELGGVCIFQNAALGGMVTPNVSSNTFEETERIGRTTAAAVVECLKSASTLNCSNLTHKTTTIEIPLENKNFLALRKAGVIGRDFHDGKVRTELHMIRLGDVEMVTIPGEALPKVGLAIKAHMKASYKFLIGLGDDELGYIIPREDFDVSKYEESMSVGPKTAPIIENGLKALLSHEGKSQGASALVLVLGIMGGSLALILRKRFRKG